LSKILVLVGSAGIDPWLKIEEEGQKKTWGQHSPPDIEVQWVRKSAITQRSPAEHMVVASTSRNLARLHSQHDGTRRREERRLSERKPSRKFKSLVSKVLSELEGVELKREDAQTLTLEVSNTYSFQPLVTLIMLERALEEFNFDFLVRTTSTSYLRLDALTDYIDELPPTNTYAGHQFQSFGGISFMSGAFNILSRDVVEKVVTNQDDLRSDTADDLALGMLIQRHSLAEFHHRPLLTIQSSLEFQQALHQPLAPVIRCRPHPTFTDLASIQLMIDLHHFIKNEKN
jgi:hypothetical protein